MNSSRELTIEADSEETADSIAKQQIDSAERVKAVYQRVPPVNRWWKRRPGVYAVVIEGPTTSSPASAPTCAPAPALERPAPESRLAAHRASSPVSSLPVPQVEPRSGQRKSSLLEFLDKSKGTDELYEMLRTRSVAEIEEFCRTFPIDSIRLSWGSIGADAKTGDVHAILSEVGSEAGLRDIKRFELITVMAQVLVRYEEILKESPHLHLPKSFPAARCADILMSRLMPFIRTQKAGDVTQTLRVRLYDFAIALMKAGGGRGDWHDRAALDCLLVSRPSLKVDHEFWIFGCRFNIALASKNPDDVAAAAKNAEQIVSGEIKVPEQYIQGAKQMLNDLKKWKVDQPGSAGRDAQPKDVVVINGLMWQSECDGEERMQEEAFAYCRSLRLGGHSDWRLPTLAEFRSGGNSLARGDNWTASDEPLLRNNKVAYINDGTTMFKTNKYRVIGVRKP